MKKYLSKKEVVELSGLSIATIDRNMKTGKLKYSKVGRLVRFEVKDYEQFMKGE